MFSCPVMKAKGETAKHLIDSALESVKTGRIPRYNLIWLEAAGCSGNIISMMNAANPDLLYFLREMVNMKYSNSLMGAEGEAAYEKFLETLDTEFILVVEGAVATKNEGLYNVIARYRGKQITGMEVVKQAGSKAKYVLAVGTCAVYGGISSARPNPSDSVSVDSILDRQVINVPGCPGHPDWVIGTIAHIIKYGVPELDNKNRPVIFYGITIHDLCTRRSYFENRIFAKRLGDVECMFRLGCRGPVTKTDCPVRRWNNTDNWPIGDNTPCIGCAAKGFPDMMEPFVRY